MKALDYFKEREMAYLNRLEKLVNMESGTSNLEGIAQCYQEIISFLPTTGVSYEVITCETGRQHLKIFKKGTKKGKILLLGHIDTVFPLGTVAERPFSKDEKYAYGPGVADMKAGVCGMTFILEALVDLADEIMDVEILINSDEEMGSRASKEIIEACAKDAVAVLVFEPGRESGGIVTGRKGVGRFTYEVEGVSAHAGSNHKDGVNAIMEMSHKAIAVSGLTDYEKGTTINVGMIQGGTTTNVVPDHCEMHMDVRFSSQEEVQRVCKEIQRIAEEPVIAGSKTFCKGGINRPPMEETQGNMVLYKTYQRLSKSLFHQDLENLFVGGASDGNFTSALGVPTLDSLGPCGGKYHNASEFVILETIVPRLTLGYGLIKEISQGI